MKGWPPPHLGWLASHPRSGRGGCVATTNPWGGSSATPLAYGVAGKPPHRPREWPASHPKPEGGCANHPRWPGVAAPATLDGHGVADEPPQA